MINIFRDNKGKLMGVYEELLTNQILLIEKDVKSYITSRLFEELKKEDTSGLFTYNIIKIGELTSPDLFGKSYYIMFEFVPNKELVEEFRYLSERLEVGL